MGGEFPQHVRDAPVMRACIQLAVGKCTGPALAELHVALGVKRAAAAEGPDLRRACVRVPAALEHYWLQAGTGERERTEHPRGAEARDHDRGPVQGKARDFISVGRLKGLTLQAHIHCVYVLNRTLAPRVQAAPLDLQLLYCARPDAELFRRERIQLVLVPAGREREIGHCPHNSLPASAPLDQAHWRLKPPQSPSMSSTSPQA